MGTVTDEQGHYQLDNIPVSTSVTLEYAFLGYRTEQVKVDLSQPNHRYAHDQRLTEQAIQLNEVYLTPNGENPCIYIMRKLHEQGQLNRKRLKTYTAVCSARSTWRTLTSSWPSSPASSKPPFMPHSVWLASTHYLTI